MKKFSTFLVALLTLVGWASPGNMFAAKSDVDAILNASQGVYRIKNRGNNRYLMENPSNHNLTGVFKTTSATMKNRQCWYMSKNGDGSYVLLNVETARSLPMKDGRPMLSVAEMNNVYVKYSAANSASTSYVTISWTKDYKNNTCYNLNNGTNHLVAWHANTPQLGDPYSDWIFEPVTELDANTVKADLQSKINSTQGNVAPTDGMIVNIMNVAYGDALSAAGATNATSCLPFVDKDYSQYWQVKINAATGRASFVNVLNGRSLQTMNYTVSQRYTTGTPAGLFTLKDGLNPMLNDYAIVAAGNVVLHEDQQKNLVGWYNDQAASNWVFRAATIDSAELQKQKDILSGNGDVSSRLGTLRTKLPNYFSDYACTELKPEIAALTEDELKARMTADNFPTLIQDMVLKVKNGTWGYREKDFRVFDYKVYSASSPWSNNNYIGTGYAFSPQTNPTGVSAKRGDMLLVYVDAFPSPGTTVKLMMTEGMNVTGQESVNLTRGLNIVNVEKNSHVFVRYELSDPNKKLADVPDMKIHIEGGYVNGVFDITRGHKNKDWTEMIANGLLTDKYVHLKSKYIQYNYTMDMVKECLHPEQMTGNVYDTDGVPKGLEGALCRWDSLIIWHRQPMNIDRFLPYFNCMFSASGSSTGNPYATSYGTYYPGAAGTLDYDQLTYGKLNDEGGNFWMIAHECGHNHQNLINMAGDTEVSVNFFSQMANFHKGANVGRGRPLSKAFEKFHEGAFRDEYDIWIRCRMYFQLWLYYEVQGHNPGFYGRLWDKMRKDPMTMSTNAGNPYSGLTNYLKFAKYASDAAGEDLSEFFQFYGFFVPVTNHETGDYSASYWTTTQEQIDQAKAYMAKYPKNHSVMFIDERIKEFPANNPGMPAGSMRYGTSSDATPGDAREVGEVGMFTDFVKNPTYVDYTYTVAANGAVTINKDGQGAVGFKVYDANGKFVYASNTYKFTMPQSLVTDGYTIYAALGDGTQRQLGTTTGIDGVTADDAAKQAKDEKAYDLTGRRTKANAPGVYIINDKRVLK